MALRTKNIVIVNQHRGSKVNDIAIMIRELKQTKTTTTMPPNNRVNEQNSG